MTQSQRSQHWRKFSNSNFKSSHSQTSSSPCQGHSRHMPRRIIRSNLRFSHASAAPNEITDNNSRSRHNQRAITSEGGHTNDESAFTSEGAKALTKSCSPQLVPRRLLWHGHCPYVHRLGKSPLVPSAPSQYSRSPHHQKRNGIHGPYERPPSATTLETRFWQRSWAPFQGIRDIPGTDACFFIKLTNIPKDRQATYGKIVCDYKPHKKEKEGVRLTVGGDRLDYSGDIATSTTEITTFKILINSTLSTADAAMMMMDIKNYYLGTPLPRF
jgi:hypothetical protein